MDKLRALQYLVRSAELGSFAAAARAMEVSTPAVTQLIGSLEAELGTPLFLRSPRGLRLTADGEHYLEVSRRALEELSAVERSFGPRGAELRGALRVGFRRSMGHQFVMPLLPRFIERHPAVQLELHPILGCNEVESLALDLAFVVGWPGAVPNHLVVRVLGPTCLRLCAAPAYLARHGTPRHPAELASHECLLVRSSGGTLLDRWLFQHRLAPGGTPVSVDVRSRLLSDDGAWLIEAACAGAGIVRTIHLALDRCIGSGALVRVLPEWRALEPPAVFVVFRASQRRGRLLRALIDFMAEAVAAHRPGPDDAETVLAPAPDWYGRTRGRQSHAQPRR